MLILQTSIKELLGREELNFDAQLTRAAFRDKSVLVTGGAGSIGSELGRQIADLQPKTILLLDRSESALFHIGLELRREFPSTQVRTVIGDIQDPTGLNHILARYGIDVVFHAAAFKHLPMMEEQVIEAVQNNVIGTWNLIESCIGTGVSKLLVVSSDKAADATSVMGLTKRVCEVMVASTAIPGFTSVRFPNVIGSSGSVVPIFESQILAGGPITITDFHVARSFMTITEAGQLLLQVSEMAGSSEIFILDIGEPIKIMDLARKMIFLRGLDPSNIEVQMIGLRPGEKLQERTTGNAECPFPTGHDKVRVLRSPVPSHNEIRYWIDQLCALLKRRDDLRVLAHLAKLVPEYSPSSIWHPAKEFIENGKMDKEVSIDH